MVGEEYADEIIMRLHATVAGVERTLGLDSRFSYSAVRIEETREIVVELSRPEVMDGLLAGLPGAEPVEEPEAGIAVNTASGDRVRVRLLAPDPGRVLWITTSVADLRREPAHTAELVSQCIMAEYVDRLKRQNDWFLVSLPGGYHGWICSWSVIEVDRSLAEAYDSRADVRVAAAVAYVLSEPREGAIPVSDAVAGSRLVGGADAGEYRKVTLPLEKKGFIRTRDLEGARVDAPDRVRLIERARRFIGIPYLWGGTSAKAFDCSGLVKRVFQLEGIDLPRDSDLQARVGALIPLEELGWARPGDLLFFGEGETVKHVAIYAGESRFIHAYGSVRVNSLDRADPLYEEKLAESVLYGRSIINGAS